MAYTVIINDDFHRADSNTVGNGWSQNSTAGGGQPHIASDKLQIGNGSASGIEPAIWQDAGTISDFPISLSLSYTIAVASTRPFKVAPYYALGSTGAGGLTGVMALLQAGSSNNIQIRNGTTQIALGSFSISAGTKYYVWFDIEVSGGSKVAKLYISTTSTKPGTPTLTSSTFTPVADGTDCVVEVDDPSGGTFNVDFVMLTSGVAPSLPAVTTDAATGISDTGATLNGEITDIGVDSPDERGFVWGTTSQSDPGNVAPASSGYDDYETESGTFSTGTFDAAITGLTASTNYYVRAYAHNSDGYVYGDEVSFVTSDVPPFRFTNIEGVTYNPDDTQTIYAERLNDILERLEALEG